MASLLAPDSFVAIKKQKVWMKRPSEFDQPLDEPHAPAVQGGYINTREFVHAKARGDIENELGEIKWLKTKES